MISGTSHSQSLVSLRDHLIQFKLIHRAYYTPYRLQKMGSSFPPECWICGGTLGGFTHIFWTCPAITGFWEEVLYINLVSDIPLQPSMSVCLLGLVEQLIPTVARHTMGSLLLFYARKAITLHWKKPAPPTSLPLYKDTSTNRGCPKK